MTSHVSSASARPTPPTQYDADCIVVGSGFGGSVMACRLSEAGRTVLVLERGKPYPPGAFPRTPLDVSTNFWDPGRGLFGLFDIWSFQKFEAVVSSGLGGGSLIYANVLLRKPEAWFSAQEHWPVSYADLEPMYRRVEETLGVTPYPYVDSTAKTRLFKRASEQTGMAWSPAPLAVSFGSPGQPPGSSFDQPGDNLHRVQRTTCHLCGECDVGCNAGAKNTMDLTYLSAADRHRARIEPLHDVKRIEALGNGAGFRVHGVRHHPPEPSWERTDPLPGEPFSYAARTLVVAAGCFGSTFLLLRNRVALPLLSDRLGTRFSGNGDYLGFVRGGPASVFNASRAPVITSYVYGADGLDEGLPDGAQPGYLLQDGGYPLVADWLGEALRPATAGRLARVAWHVAMARLTRRSRTEVSSRLTEALGDASLSRGTLPVLGMGRDVPAGRMSLQKGALDIAWSHDSSDALFARMESALRPLARQLGGRFHPGPSRRVSRMITVHPVGGCPMASTSDRGVVDDHGEVFGYPGLFVCDGSVMPGPVGSNPSMTIAALAERFSARVLERTA